MTKEEFAIVAFAADNFPSNRDAHWFVEGKP